MALNAAASGHNLVMTEQTDLRGLRRYGPRKSKQRHTLSAGFIQNSGEVTSFYFYYDFFFPPHLHAGESEAGVGVTEKERAARGGVVGGKQCLSFPSAALASI